jgi:hypothetical protein
MLLNWVFSQKLIGEHPRLEFDKPKLSEDGRWLVSGKMIVEFTQGPFVSAEDQHFSPGTGLAIAVPFSDAQDEKDAIMQAAKRLRQVAAEIEEIASALLTVPDKALQSPK